MKKDTAFTRAADIACKIAKAILVTGAVIAGGAYIMGKLDQAPGVKQVKDAVSAPAPTEPSEAQKKFSHYKGMRL